MAKKIKSAEKQQKKAPKAPKNAPEAKVETVETQAPATATPAVSSETKVNAVLGHTTGQLDANRRMDMLTNMRVMFHEDPRSRQNLGDDIVDAIDDIVRAGLIVALADYSVNNDDAFAAVLKSSEYPALVVAADKMGIHLPALKALPAGEDAGTVVLPTTEVKVDEGVAETLKDENEKKSAGDKGQIELDPKKLAKTGSDEDVEKALTYIMIKKPKVDKCGIGETLVAVRDFIHSYRSELAKMAENKDEALKAVIHRSTYEELNDAFSFVKPTFLFSKIGEGLDDIISVEKCPLSAFIIVRTLLTDKEGNVAWTDEDIASATHAIVELYEKEEIRRISEEIEAKKDSEDEKILNANKDYIEDRKKVLNYVENFNFDICEYDKQQKFTEGFNAVISKARGRVIVSYYPEYKEIDNTKVHMGLNENVTQRAGIILNLFRSPGNKNVAYDEANLTTIETKPYGEGKEKEDGSKK